MFLSSKCRCHIVVRVYLQALSSSSNPEDSWSAEFYTSLWNQLWTNVFSKLPDLDKGCLLRNKMTPLCVLDLNFPSGRLAYFSTFISLKVGSAAAPCPPCTLEATNPNFNLFTSLTKRNSNFRCVFFLFFYGVFHLNFMNDSSDVSAQPPLGFCLYPDEESHPLLLSTSWCLFQHSNYRSVTMQSRKATNRDGWTSGAGFVYRPFLLAVPCSGCRENTVLWEEKSPALSNSDSVHTCVSQLTAPKVLWGEREQLSHGKKNSPGLQSCS